MLTELLRVPPEPEAPFGAPGSLRVFRAAGPYLYYRLFTWALRQAGAAVGLLLFLVWSPELDPTAWVDELQRTPGEWVTAAYQSFDRLGGLALLEALAVAGFVLQLPVGAALTVLDYRYRWYLITDRSLRVREGVVRLHERTMTFSNLQHVAVRQGPLQRLLGISDLEVRTAGGGDKNNQQGDRKESDDFHIGRFRGVDNAAEIRDAIIARLRRVRSDELRGAVPPSGPESPAGAVEAARMLLVEARELRRALEA